MARVSDETDEVSYTEATTVMSARSSSSSWPGAGERAPDIIDLDRYMRGSVRPHGRHRPNAECDRLVVDAGGPKAAQGPVKVGGSQGGAAASPRPKSSSTASAPRDKRYSHDSGLSDGSYVRRRTHRRVMGENASVRAHRERERLRERTATSSNSMRTFRAACERALRDQQEQIARVAQLCERLTVKNERGGGAAPKLTSVSCTQDSSDISSSSISRSTRDKARKDKHRSNEFKTYKIIMNKLDELNRLFAARARSTPPPRRPVPLRQPPPPAPRASSGESVSMSDKLVSTEPQLERHHAGRAPRSIPGFAAQTEARPVLISPRTPRSVAHSTSQRRSPALVERGVGAGCSGRAVIARLATAHAHAFDIAPAEARSGRLNVANESLVEYDSDVDGSIMAQSPHLNFDLDNPLHLYYQAKRMQSSQKKRMRAHSLDHDGLRIHSNEKSHDHTHYVSLCGRCHGYWRALTTLATQLFNRPDKDPDIY